MKILLYISYMAMICFGLPDKNYMLVILTCNLKT